MDDIPKIEIVWPSGQAGYVDAERAYGLHLTDRVFNTPEGIAGLSYEERAYYMVLCLDGEVVNGGFHQYFFNSAGNYYDETIVALDDMGATRVRDMLAEAQLILFKDKVPPTDWEERRKVLGYDVNLIAQVDRLEQEYYNGEGEKLYAILANYAQKHRLIERYIEEYKPKIQP